MNPTKKHFQWQFWSVYYLGKKLLPRIIKRTFIDKMNTFSQFWSVCYLGKKHLRRIIKSTFIDKMNTFQFQIIRYFVWVYLDLMSHIHWGCNLWSFWKFSGVIVFQTSCEIRNLFFSMAGPILLLQMKKKRSLKNSTFWSPIFC